MTDHLRPTAEIASHALLPGDPGRALALAQELLESPRMANHARGLWGYTALTPEGRQLTVQSTGIGGPSVAVVVHELHGLGVRRAIRIGTCTAIGDGLPAGSLVTAASALDENGTKTAPRDPALARALAASGGAQEVAVASAERYYDPDEADRREAWAAAGAQVVDLGTAALFEVGNRLGMEVASALVVARSGAIRLSDEEVEARSLELGRLASAALFG
jgi:uridine phosphorylase